MTTMIRCDRCRATEPLGETLRQAGWTIVPANDEHDRLFLDVCPGCQTATEKKAHAEKAHAEAEQPWRENTDARYSGTPPAVLIAHFLVELTEDARDYGQVITGAQGIGHIVADLGLDAAGVDTWFTNHREQINQAIHDDLEARSGVRLLTKHH